MNTYGYIRVSTKEQNEERQLVAMREFGVEESRIVLDKQSGKDFDRPGYRRLLSYVAQTEREFNRQRQAEGIAAAKARGVHFGRNFKERGENYGEIVAAWRRGELSGRAAARALNVTHGTFQRWCRE